MLEQNFLRLRFARATKYVTANEGRKRERKKRKGKRREERINIKRSEGIEVDEKREKRNGECEEKQGKEGYKKVRGTTRRRNIEGVVERKYFALSIVASRIEDYYGLADLPSALWIPLVIVTLSSSPPSLPPPLSSCPIYFCSFSNSGGSLRSERDASRFVQLPESILTPDEKSSRFSVSTFDLPIYSRGGQATAGNLSMRLLPAVHTGIVERTTRYYGT